MPVITLSRRQPDTNLLRGLPADRPEPVPHLLLVRFVASDAGQRLVTCLARAAASAAGQGSPRPRPAGLLAELVGRSGRQVDAWLALTDAGGLQTAAGLIAMATTGTPPRVRRSISWLVVHPAFRRRGVGRLLVEQACRHAGERGGVDIWVECRSDWAAALTFWTALGFSGHGST